MLSLAAVAAAALAGGALGDPAGSSQGAFQNPASPVAREINSLFITITIIAFAVGIVVEALLVYTILKFRAGQAGDAQAHAGDGENAPGGAMAKRTLPPHYHNKKLEAGITGFTAFAFAMLVVFSWGTLNAIETPSEPVGLNVEVTGHQWAWEFGYPAQGVLESQSLSEMHVPVNTVVRLNVTSTDVAHSVWIPDLGVKIDAYPGRINHFWFKAEREGRFFLQCAEFCGGAHSNMHAVVVSQTQASFDAWVVAKHAAANPPPPPLPDGASVDITLSDSRITSSRPLDIDLGANITFRLSNAGTVAHAFALEAPYNWSSPLVSAGSTLTVSVVFDQAVQGGAFFCPVAGHRAAGMVGSFNVSASGRVIDLYLYDLGSTGGPKTWAIEPASVTVTPGELVKFRVHNEGAMAHNVKVGDPYVGVISPNVAAGAITTTPAFTVSESTQYWCDIPGHRQLGMVGTLDAGGAVHVPGQTVPGFELMGFVPALCLAALAATRLRSRAPRA